MSNAFNSVEEQRHAVPIAKFVTSKSPNGALFSMNVFIKPEMFDDYVKVVTPVVHKLRAFPECNCCEISVNPTDKGHIRIIHCWTTDTAWFEKVRLSLWREFALQLSNMLVAECRDHAVVWGLYQITRSHEGHKQGT